jgi:hypothetical protein
MTSDDDTTDAESIALSNFFSYDLSGSSFAKDMNVVRTAIDVSGDKSVYVALRTDAGTLNLNHVALVYSPK